MLSPASVDERPLTVTGDGCEDASGHSYAQRGDLSIGPFMSDALSIAAGNRAAKLWIASQRDGRDDAQLAITGPAGTAHQARHSDEAFVSNARQFYPG